MFAILLISTMAPPEFEYADLKRPADKVSATVGKDRVVFTVSSSTGIGAATIKLKAGEWPSAVVIRFQYDDGRGFTGLENFRLTSDTLVAVGSLKDNGKVPFSFRSAKGESDSDQNDTGTAGTLAIKAMKTDAGIELHLPANMMTGSKSLQLSWIDFYR